jgi:uncharacterized protein (TIGR00369 family)
MASTRQESLQHQMPETPADQLVNARQAIASQAFSRLIGAWVESYGDGIADLRVTIRDDLRQQHGFVHGGVLSYLADNALTMAGALALGPQVVTGEFKINYLRPVLSGVLIARASPVNAGKTQVVCRCDILCENEEGRKLVAVAQGTIARLGQAA